jgi:Tat protein secretion system quality control protein TatD with DNase activity
VGSGNEIEFVDSHCHLNFGLLMMIEMRLLRMPEGMEYTDINRIDIETSKSAIEIAHTYPSICGHWSSSKSRSTWNDTICLN